MGSGPSADRLLAADHQGTVRLISGADATPLGRLPEAIPLIASLTTHEDGTVTVLDGHGRLHRRQGAAAAAPTGLLALLDDGPHPVERLLDEVQAHVRGIAPTALASAGRTIVVADAAGTVHAFDATAGGPRTASLHRGPVTAVAALDLAISDDGATVPLLYSGGADGTVRAWAPRTDPLPEPALARPCAVTALAVSATEAGPVLACAWADGLVEHHMPDMDVARDFRPGGRVHSLAFTADGHLVVGTDEALVCLSTA
ncbi:hypothetical protein V2W30_06065 [Streptomyces sp. Q6]|uniref:Uncharacterized protein n=1 Tax=Streptomyces citrinus TaxID=3118173 RepID=A0ACD5A7F8_9ACTN